jgi:ubiquitin carboxyl-terminal hydrolase 7
LTCSSTVKKQCVQKTGEVVMEGEHDDRGRAEGTFQFRVDNISRLRETVFSPPSFVRNLPWRMMVMRRSHHPVSVSHSIMDSFSSETVVHVFAFRHRAQDGKIYDALSFFLECNADAETPSWSCNARADLRILKHNGGEPVALGKLSITLNHRLFFIPERRALP